MYVLFTVKTSETHIRLSIRHGLGHVCSYLTIQITLKNVKFQWIEIQSKKSRGKDKNEIVKLNCIGLLLWEKGCFLGELSKRTYFSRIFPVCRQMKRNMDIEQT